jgi:peptidyl-lysine (3S)-dioxygenase / protease
MAASATVPAEWAQAQLKILQEDYHDFNSSTVPALPYPSALQFSKIVARGQPCVFDVYHPGEESRWLACSWTKEDLQSKVRDEVEIAITPCGNADALVALEPEHDCPEGIKVFLQPASDQQTVTHLLDVLSKKVEPVCYLQSQNSNLTTTALEPLLEDLPINFDFAEEVLGDPDARNIWIGDDRSTTSVHRDPYENLYLVLRGSKTFRLWAPVDEVSMPTKMVRTGRYEYSKHSGFRVVMDEDNEIPWVDLDPLAVGCEVGKMRTVTVHAGQMLFLPGGWYHHVSQQCGVWDDGSPSPCIAVNYWYDQDYEGERYVMRQLMNRLVEAAKAS